MIIIKPIANLLKIFCYERLFYDYWKYCFFFLYFDRIF